MKDIKNMIIDFGGVLYRIDPKNALNSLNEFSTRIDLFTNPEVLNKLHKIVTLYEIGNISSKEFHQHVTELLALKCNWNEFFWSWNSILLSLEKDAVHNISLLKNKGHIILLSNTNISHFNHFYPECRELFSLFDDLYFSFQIGLYKPEIEIFEHVIKTSNLNIDETIFIDDLLANLESAQEIGLTTYQINDYNLSEVITNIIQH